MRLETAPRSARTAQSRNENRNFPQREAPPPSLSKSAILDRLTEANSTPTLPAAPAPEVTAASVAGLSPMQALDAANGSTVDPLRHRRGSIDGR